MPKLECIASQSLGPLPLLSATIRLPYIWAHQPGCRCCATTERTFWRQSQAGLACSAQLASMAIGTAPKLTRRAPLRSRFHGAQCAAVQAVPVCPGIAAMPGPQRPVVSNPPACLNLGTCTQPPEHAPLPVVHSMATPDHQPAACRCELRATSSKLQARVALERQWLQLRHDHGLPVHIFRLSGVHHVARCGNALTVAGSAACG